MERLTRAGVAEAADLLGERDPALRASLRRWGPPPLWAREPSFATIVHLILEQQVSLASAQAAFDRLEERLGRPVMPEALLGLDDGTLRAIGFSRQKARYARALAISSLDGFALTALGRQSDDEVRRALMAHPGIGRWTAEVYLTMCLRRPDVWPHGDLALATSAAHVLELAVRPSFDELEAIAERWRPWRAVAARILWHDYLRERGLPV